MTMTVELRDYSGVLHGLIADGTDALARALPATGDPDYPYLGLLDEYDNTTFTPLQMTAVLPEIRKLISQRGPSDVLDQLEQLAELCQGGVLIYLTFVGD